MDKNQASFLAKSTNPGSLVTEKVFRLHGKVKTTKAQKKLNSQGIGLNENPFAKKTNYKQLTSFLITHHQHFNYIQRLAKFS